MQEGWRSVERVQDSVRGLEKVETVLVWKVFRVAPAGAGRFEKCWEGSRKFERVREGIESIGMD